MTATVVLEGSKYRKHLPRNDFRLSKAIHKFVEATYILCVINVSEHVLNQLSTK